MHYLISPKLTVMYKIQTTSSQLNMIKIKETDGHEAVGPKMIGTVITN
jgi:hypothetical protein